MSFLLNMNEDGHPLLPPPKSERTRVKHRREKKAKTKNLETLTNTRNSVSGSSEDDDDTNSTKTSNEKKRKTSIAGSKASSNLSSEADTYWESFVKANSKISSHIQQGTDPVHVQQKTVISSEPTAFDDSFFSSKPPIPPPPPPDDDMIEEEEEAQSIGDMTSEIRSVVSKVVVPTTYAGGFASALTVRPCRLCGLALMTPVADADYEMIGPCLSAITFSLNINMMVNVLCAKLNQVRTYKIEVKKDLTEKECPIYTLEECAIHLFVCAKDPAVTLAWQLDHYTRLMISLSNQLEVIVNGEKKTDLHVLKAFDKVNESIRKIFMFKPEKAVGYTNELTSVNPITKQRLKT